MNACKAEAMEEWFTRTWKEVFDDKAQNDSQNQLIIDDSYSIQSNEVSYNNHSNNTSLGGQFQPPVSSNSFELYPLQTSPYSNNNTNFFQNSGFPQLMPIYSQPGISSNSVRKSSQTQIRTSSNNTTNQPSNGLFLQTLQSTNSKSFEIPRPPERTHFIGQEEVAAMKNDKECTGQLLHLIYWEVIDNCCTLKEINHKQIQDRLKTKADYPLWGIIYNLDAFSHFPGLVDTIIKHADGGLATGQHALGIMYLIGRGVPKDLQKAVHFLELSSSQGHAKSQDELGALYMKGNAGLKENKAEGVRLFTLAADQGYVMAKIDVGMCYSCGDGVEKSEDQALKYYFDANSKSSKNLITKLLTPVSTYGSHKFFSEKTFFANIEEELIQLVSLYHSDVPLNNSYSSFPEIQRTKLAEYRSWVYDTLTKEAIPLVKSLKTVSPGFMIDCLKVKEGVTISRSKTNPAPAFFSACHSTSHINLGEENVVISAQLHKVTDFFYEAGNKLDEILNIKENSKNEANSSPILEKKNSLLDLGNKLESLTQLLEQASAEEKPIYQNKILKTQCNIKIINTEISNLQKKQETLLKEQETVSILERGLNKFKPVGKLLIDYCAWGAAGRNEYFLENYPYLRAK